jgi:predicted ArsR family transcriptional regulator
MKTTKLDERFFDSTRGRIVSLLRGATKTVNELAEELELTDNAVRSHLPTLERDGLIRQCGLQRGTRKPHFAYELAPEGENLFPKAYDALLNQLIAVLEGRLGPEALEAILREVGRSIAAQQSSAKPEDDLDSRAQRALRALSDLGGSARIEREDDKLFISSTACPFAAVVTEHPDVCQLAEALIAQIMETKVREHCDRQDVPKCRFAVQEIDLPSGKALLHDV